MNLQCLRRKIRSLRQQGSIDVVNPLNYAFKHDFSLLLSSSKIVKEARTEGEGRCSLLYQVNH